MSLASLTMFLQMVQTSSLSGSRRMSTHTLRMQCLVAAHSADAGSDEHHHDGPHVHFFEPSMDEAEAVARHSAAKSHSARILKRKYVQLLYASNMNTKADGPYYLD